MRPTLGSYDSLIYMTDGKRVLAKEHIDTIQLFNWCDYSGKLTKSGKITYKRIREALDKAQKGKPFHKRKRISTPRDWAGQHFWSYFNLDRLPVTTNRQIVYKGRPFADFIMDNRERTHYAKQQTMNVISQAIRADGLPCSPVYLQKASFSTPRLLWMHGGGDTISVAIAEPYYDLIYTLFKGSLFWYYDKIMDCFIATTEGHKKTFGRGIIAIVASFHVTKQVAERYNFTPYGGPFAKQM